MHTFENNSFFLTVIPIVKGKCCKKHNYNIELIVVFKGFKIKIVHLTFTNKEEIYIRICIISKNRFTFIPPAKFN